MGSTDTEKSKLFSFDPTDQRIIAILVLLSSICYVFQSIGLVSPFWITYVQGTTQVSVDYNYGLWSQCSSTTSGPTACTTWDSGDLTDAFRAAQTFELLAFICQTSAEIGAIISAFHDNKNYHTLTVLVSGILFIVSSIVTGLGIIFISVDNSIANSSISWALGFSIFGGLSSLGFGFFFIFTSFILRRQEKIRDDIPKINVTYVKGANGKY